MGIGYVKRNMNGKFNIQTIYSESIWKFRKLCTVFFWKRCEKCNKDDGTRKMNLITSFRLQCPSYNSKGSLPFFKYGAKIFCIVLY